MIERARDARVVLGLGASAGPAEARAAFHALCKKYHPARFARSSPETVRLANEAFLAIKRAYDTIVKPADAAPKPVTDAPSGRVTAPIPAVPRTTTPIPRTTGAVPAQRPTPQPMTAIPRSTAPITPTPAPAPRSTTPITPVPRATAKVAAIEPATPAPPARSAPAVSEEQRFASALELLRRRLWKDAEKALSDLAISHPAEKRYRAYRHYARGRIAQDDGRLDDARGEWERALRLDPELAAAKAAIESLPEPPKPTGGGLLSKLFKR
jgi:tetratricopeptide (TPR) repeat protein